MNAKTKMMAGRVSKNKVVRSMRSTSQNRRNIVAIEKIFTRNAEKTTKGLAEIPGMPLNTFVGR